MNYVKVLECIGLEMRYLLQGYLQGEKGMYPVFTQTRVGSIEKMSVLDELARMD